MRVRYIGFTLAEVLITLMVIGVLAVVTIPSLMQAFEKMVLKNQAKQALSILYQALYKTTSEDDFKCYLYSSGTKISDCGVFFEELFSNLNLANKCSGKSTMNGCIPDYTEAVKITDGGCSGYWTSTSRYAYVLTNGIILVTYSNFVSPATYPLFLVDTNGVKPPNKSGYDVFSLYVYKKDTGEYTFSNGLEPCLNMESSAYFKTIKSLY